MNTKDFVNIRKKINKTQKEMAILLGISKKTIESYEQGLRNIPQNIARILYFIYFKLNISKMGKLKNCWDEQDCREEDRKNCMAWIAQEGIYCWFITGKTCPGRKRQPSYSSSDNCYNCSFFIKQFKEIL